MKRTSAVILMGLLFSLNLFSQSTEYKIDVTYIANAGFLIESSGKKVLIDALFKNGWNNYLTPADSIVSKILNQQAPFNQVNLMLITHNHEDHFNDSMVVAYLNNNSENILIAPPLVTNAIFKNPALKKNENQIVELDKISREKNDKTINGIKVFHSGDFNGSETVEFGKLELQKEQIDIALLNFYGFWSTKEERLFTEEYIHPKRIALTHIPPTEIKIVKDSAKLINDFIDITVFECSMKKKSFIFESAR
jgi:L-ascorbate metabolism protein UlaG (beta-lactamase superfamily)